VTAYLQTAEPERKQILKDCYQEITGEDIEVRSRSGGTNIVKFSSPTPNNVKFKFHFVAHAHEPMKS
jgi:hypothetical protein